MVRTGVVSLGPRKHLVLMQMAWPGSMRLRGEKLILHLALMLQPLPIEGHHIATIRQAPRRLNVESVPIPSNNPKDI